MTELAMRLWAKTEKGTDQIHPLLFHMIDAAEVGLALWEKSLSPALQKQFSNWLNCEPELAARTIAFWIGLHDLGKASPAFQRKYPPIQSELESCGLGFPILSSPMLHGLLTAWSLESLLPATGLTKKETKLIGRALAGHHGSWPTAIQLIDFSKDENLGGNYKETWDSVRRWIFETLRDLLDPASICHLPEEDCERNVFLTLLSGYVSTADWIASMENWFPYTSKETPFRDYLASSHQRAENAISRLGFCGLQADGSSFDFQNVFGFPPTELQRQVLEKASKTDLPAMLIIEAPTGCGKTEIAFSVADTWLQQEKGRGIYVAMPTTATSNQMFNRTRNNYLSHRYPTNFVNLQLAHGSALLSNDFQNMILQSVGEDFNAGVVAMGWFLPHKRTLLAPFAVGTVDQALLSVLQTRHFFVRLFGLGGKVIIFDEVHAYDTYMSSLFCRLLEWLNAAGISVIILSATLPNQTRKHLIEAYTGKTSPEAVSGYPKFTLVSPSGIHSDSLPAEEKPPIELEWIEPSPDAIVSTLKTKLVNGGCAAIICNTVKRAQEVYQAVKEANLCPIKDCILFHARFPFERRLEIEKQVLNRFGKEPEGGRPSCSIVVATQVIEQSLDLDFDVMISDLAPIDLLIQRAGRLQRHNCHSRPVNLKTPTLILCNPTTEDPDAPDFGGSRYVYEPYLLLRTLAILQGKPQLKLPVETPCLIEAVYSEKEIPGLDHFQSLLSDARAKMLKNDEKAQLAARNRLILPPTDSGLLGMENDALEEEDPTIHASLQALTRLAAPGIQLVCLHRLPNGDLNTHADGSGTKIFPGMEPDHITQQALLCASINIQNYDVVHYFQSTHRLITWKQVPALRFHYLAEFMNGECQPDGATFRLILDPFTGLSIKKEVR